MILGEPEFFFLKYKNLNEIEFSETIIFNHEFKLDDLPYPDWKGVIKKNKKVYYLVWKNHFQFWLQGDVHILALSTAYIRSSKDASRDIE